MSIPAPFTPLSNNLNGSMQFNNRPINTSNSGSNFKKNVINQYYIGHIYSIVSTVPIDYLYWFSQPPVKTLTVTGESKSQILNTFRNAVLQSKL